MPDITLTAVINTRFDLTEGSLLFRGQRPLIIGDTYSIQVSLLNPDGTPFDLSDVDPDHVSVTFTAKYRYQDSDDEAIVQEACTIETPPTDGIVELDIASDSIDGDSLIRGYFDMTYKLADVVKTLIYGDIEFLPRVTVGS